MYYLTVQIPQTLVEIKPDPQHTHICTGISCYEIVNGKLEAKKLKAELITQMYISSLSLRM